MSFRRFLPTTAFATLAALAAATPVQAMDQAAALDWAKKSTCAACHGMDNKLVGPAWREIAKKYAGNASAEATLVTKVRQGGKGNWGQIPMPPNPTVKEAEVKTFVKFVLTLK